MITQQLIESDNKKIEIIRETYPLWQRTWTKNEEMIKDHTDRIIKSIKSHLNYLHGDWGGIEYGILPDLYTKWLKQQGITL